MLIFPISNGLERNKIVLLLERYPYARAISTVTVDIHVRLIPKES